LKFDADDVKKHMRKHPACYRQGVFHNYVYVCMQLFLFNVIEKAVTIYKMFFASFAQLVRHWKRKETNKG